MLCAYCGRKLKDTAKFCPYCGKRNYKDGSKFAQKFDSQDDLLVVKAQEIFQEARTKNSHKRKKVSVRAIVITFCAALICAGVFISVKFITPAVRYENAEKLYIDGKLSEAEKEFSELGNYKNSVSYVLKCRYESALEMMKNGLFPEAADAFTSLNGYGDSDRLAAECMIEIADSYVKKGSLEAAASLYAAAGKPELIKPSAEEKAAELAESGDFFGASEISAKYVGADDAREYRYLGASDAKENGDYKTAADNFYILKDYKNSNSLAEECAYCFYSSEYAEKGASEETARGFYFLGDFRDSRELFKKISYEYGKKCLKNGDCFTAAAMFRNAGSYSDSAEMVYKARYALGKSLLESDPASARSVFALLSTYSDSSKKKKAAAEKLDEKESWYADGFTSADGYYTSEFKKSDVLLVSCTAGTEVISAPVTLILTLRDSTGGEVSAECENVRNSGSFSVSFSLSELPTGAASVVISRSDSGSVLRTINISINE